MNFTKFLDNYQKILVEEYKKNNIDAINYSDEEIMLMNPITEQDLTMLKVLYLNHLLEKKKELVEEYDEAKEDLNRAFGMQKSEIREDMRIIFIKINEISKEITIIKEQIEGKEQNKYGAR